MKNKLKIIIKTKKKFYGPEGHIILEDTFGLHKGEVPTINTRSMLILIYGINQGIKDYNFSLALISNFP